MTGGEEAPTEGMDTSRRQTLSRTVGELVEVGPEPGAELIHRVTWTRTRVTRVEGSRTRTSPVRVISSQVQAGTTRHRIGSLWEEGGGRRTSHRQDPEELGGEEEEGGEGEEEEEEEEGGLEEGRALKAKVTAMEPCHTEEAVTKDSRDSPP